MADKRLYSSMLVDGIGQVLDVWMDTLEFESDAAAVQNYRNMANKVRHDPIKGLDEGSMLIVIGEGAALGYREEVLIPVDAEHLYEVDFGKIK